MTRPHHAVSPDNTAYATTSRRHRCTIAATWLAVALLVATPAYAGDATYGTVEAVKSANTVTFKHDSGAYEVLMIGVDVPKNPQAADMSRQFITSMAVGKRAQFRFNGRDAQGRMVGKIYLDDSSGKVVDLGLEMVRAGMATPARDTGGYKYDELNTAMREARSKKMGVWKNTPGQ